jgi:hypothetical protein
MQVYATLDELNGEVKIKLFVDGEWHAMIINRAVFDLTKHTKGEIIKRVLMVQ